MLDALPMAQRVAPLAVVHAAAVRGHLAPARALAGLPGALEIAAILGRQPALACKSVWFMMVTCCITVSCLDNKCRLLEGRAEEVHTGWGACQKAALCLQCMC